MGAWGRQMHPDLSAAVIEPHLLTILPGIKFLRHSPIGCCNSM